MDINHAPTVKLIGITRFFGVPDELLPDEVAPGGLTRREHLHENRRQDLGTDGERLIECAGRNCYDSYGRGRTSAEFHEHILEVGHGNVAQHVNLTYYVSGVSRGLSHELVRHGVGSCFSQRSTRYVDESSSAWILHPLLRRYLRERDDSSVIHAIAEAQGKARIAYDQTVLALQAWLEEQGAGKFNARKQARGAARGFLGNALETALVWTVNVRELRNVIEQRVTEAADAEIRELIYLAYEIARAEVPAYFNDYDGAPCADGVGVELHTEHRKI